MPLCVTVSLLMPVPVYICTYCMHASLSASPLPAPTLLSSFHVVSLRAVGNWACPLFTSKAALALALFLCCCPHDSCYSLPCGYSHYSPEFGTAVCKLDHLPITQPPHPTVLSKNDTSSDSRAGCGRGRKVWARAGSATNDRHGGGGSPGCHGHGPLRNLAEPQRQGL